MTYEHIKVNSALRQIHFGCPVSHVSAAELFAALATFKGADASLVFNTYGGETDAGIACHDAIRLYPGKVHGTVLGTCQSAGVLIYAACDTRDISPNSTLMIHDGDLEFGSVHPREFVKQAAELRRVDRLYNALLAKRVGRSVKQINKLSLFATFFTAEEAVAHGFAERVLGTKKTARRQSRRGAKLNAKKGSK